MSFDLAVWNSEPAFAERKSSRIYEGLCRREEVEGLTASPATELFYKELIARWPEVDARRNRKAGDRDSSPWLCALDHSDRHVLMSCDWSRSADVYLFVQELARVHGLVFFDPQSEEVYLPDQSDGE